MPAGGTPVPADRVVTVTYETETEKIPYRTSVVRDPSMPRGTREERTAGVPGRRSLRFRVTTVDGQRTDRRLVESTVLREPVTRVVAVGTGKGNGRPDHGCRGGNHEHGAYGNEEAAAYGGEVRIGYASPEYAGYGVEHAGYGGEVRVGYGSEEHVGYGSVERAGYGSVERAGYGGQLHVDYGDEESAAYGGDHDDKRDDKDGGNGNCD